MATWKKYGRIVILTALLLAVAGCNPGVPAPAATAFPTADLSVVKTEAVQTVIASLTAEALANPTAIPTLLPSETSSPVPTLTAMATSTPLATATPTRVSGTGGGGGGGYVGPTATVYTDRAKYVSQSLKDGIVMKPGQDFDMVWTVKNTGFRDWTPDFYYQYMSGDLKPVKGETRVIGQVVGKNDNISLRVDFIAPSEPGRYTSNWAIINDDGVDFFHMYIVINVQ